MTYAWTQEVPIDMPVYERIRALIGSEPADGLLLHVVSRVPGGLRYFDVWESEEVCDRFFEERVHPAVGRVFTQMGMTYPDAEPPRTPVEVTDLWIPAGAPA